MGFIKAGFTGGFLGIVISIAHIFVNSRILEKLSSVGLYVADFFGKACINSETVQCTLAERFTTILATIVGNTIAYFIIFALISMGFSIIKMWFKSKPKEPEASQPVQAPQVQEQQVQIQTAQTQSPVQLQQPLPVQPQQQSSQQSTQQVQIEQPQIMEVQIKQPGQTQEKQKIKKSPKKKAKITKKSKKK